MRTNLHPGPHDRPPSGKEQWRVYLVYYPSWLMPTWFIPLWPTVTTGRTRRWRRRHRARDGGYGG
ncbi:hypothetical protein ACFOY4_40825 [Actinomadura syzygii]|uniref:hypothetical protein n=1 Tax=Actinomadura syzygii TaxID=1427538 RepID=UPI00165263DF|nr:hypothetical protein [Actinomadura syzygii]